ncbi:MAG: ABC transporter substrate-binding protein [Candidatus Bathyarchaeota archaeon]
MFNSRALTKIQTIILVAIIVVAAVGVGVTYVLLGAEEQTSGTIKIGFLGDLDGVVGKPNWQAAILAVEEINAEGGILGRQVELIGEDHDGGTDSVILTNALTKLITIHNVDFIVGGAGGSEILLQDIIAQHKIICISGMSIPDAITQRVLDDYDTFKYYFSTMFNDTCAKLGMTDSLIHIREMTGFNKVGYLVEDLGWSMGMKEGLDVFLPENGFELVYKGTFPLGTVDFSSYFAAAEAAGVEVMVPMIAMDGGIPFVKEYYDRQSPMLVFGGTNLLASDPRGWEWTEGKCNHMDFGNVPTTTGYPFTSKTLPTRDAYMNRWGEAITWTAATVYDGVKFILTDAIERAGTIETDAVIEALEETSVETSNARDFVFTESHALMMGKDANDPNADHSIVMGFQWQDGVQVPVDPLKLMKEANATITFPDWPGPWDDLD